MGLALAISLKPRATEEGAPALPAPALWQVSASWPFYNGCPAPSITLQKPPVAFPSAAF